MSVVTDIRKSVSEATPVLAVLGATDLAVAKVRQAAVELPAEFETRVNALQAEVGKAVDPAVVQKFVAQIPQLPTKAADAASDVRDLVETRYATLAQRGKTLIKQVESTSATKSLVRQGKATLDKSKAAVTTARTSVEDTADSATKLVDAAVEDVTAATSGKKTSATRTRAALKSTAQTARRGTTKTATAAKTAAGTARKTAAKAPEAVAKAAKTIGD